MRLCSDYKRGASALTLLCCVALAGCGNKNKRADDLVSDKDPVRGFLATIPADTPYAFVAVEPMPLAPMLSWFGGWADSVTSMLQNIGDVLQDEYLPPETKLVYAVVDEMSGKYTAEGLKSLGFSVSPRFALYGIGMLPALRVDLEDPDAFKAFVGRVEKKSGISSQAETLGKTDFWTYSLQGDYIVMAVQNRQLVWGYTESAAAETYTAYLLGEKLPPKSMADDDRITPLAAKHGFKRFGVGFVDFARLAQLWLEPGSSMHDEIVALLDPAMQQAPAECIADTKRLVATAPRLVFGYEAWSSTEVTFGAGVELTNDVGTRLKQAKTAAPLVGSELFEQAPFSAAFGFDVGKVLDVVNGELLSVQQAPFQCSWFAEFNSIANEVLTFGAIATPPMVTNLQGGAVLVQRVREVARTTTTPPPMPPDGTLDPNQPPPMMPTGPLIKVEGIGVVTSTAPAALLAFMRTLRPEFENVTPDPGGIPLALPPSEMLEDFEDPHVILTPTALALTSGVGVPDEAARLVTAAPSADAPWATLSWDWRKIIEMVSGGRPAGPTDPLLDALGIGRTVFALEPRDTGFFMHMQVALPAPR